VVHAPVTLLNETSLTVYAVVIVLRGDSCNEVMSICHHVSSLKQLS
jgi:hypothetical protein